MDMTKRHLLPPIGLAIISIGLGTATALLGQLAICTWTGITPLLIWVFIGAGIISAALGHIFTLPKWWIPVNFAFPIVAYLSLSTSIPSWVYLLCFLTLALVYWNSALERVPLYLSNLTTWRAIDNITQQHSGSFLDLGCGLGGILFYLAKRHPKKLFVGIESAPLIFLFAKARQILTHQANVDIRYGNFWKQNFSAYSTIYAFLSPAPMARVFEKISQEMPKGGTFISNSFAVPEIQPKDIITLKDRRQTELLIWII